MAGPSAAEQKAFAAEKNVAIVRLAVITFNIVVYWTALYPQGVPWLALVVSVVAFAYGVYVIAAQPFRRFPVLTTSLWTASTDGILILLWIHATGGYGSPFYLLWYLSLMAVTFRYDWMGTLTAALLYAAGYVALLAATGGLAGNETDVVVRVVYILLVGALGALLGRESLQVFDERFRLTQQVQEAHRFRALAEASPEAIVIHDDGVVLEANRAFCDLLGVPRERLLGMQGLDLATAADRPVFLRYLTDRSDNPFELWATLPDGRRRRVRLQARTLDFHGRKARVTSVRDVTEERAAQEARETALANEMELTRLREIDRFKTDFINTAAHELNTPLTPLKIELHLLKRQLPDDGSVARHTVDLLDRNLSRLSLLVQDMLDVARLQNNRLRLEPASNDVAAILAESLDTFRETARLRGIRLEARFPERLEAVVDAARVTQIVHNLVSNALKFTPADGLVVVEAAKEQDATGAWIRIDVRDTGVGLTPDQVDRLFQPFRQLHRDTINTAGTGLGLYISRGLAERHGGTVTCSSPGLGLGTTFTVRLPADGPPAAVASTG